MDCNLKKYRKDNERLRNQRGGKTLLDLDYAGDLSILDESGNKRKEVLEVLRVQSARICLKINIKKTK